MAETKRYTIQELSELTGYSRRTIRYYVQEGLLAPPAGRGRGGFYFDSHLSRLLEMRSLQGRGVSLASISQVLSGSSEEERAPPAALREVWFSYRIAPGVEIAVRKDVEEKLSKELADLIKVAKSIIGHEGNEDD